MAQADDDEIKGLIACGWGGEEPADHVAEFFETRTPEVGALFTYLHNMRGRRNAPGFECYVDQEAAEAWVRKYRPHLVHLLEPEE